MEKAHSAPKQIMLWCYFTPILNSLDRYCMDGLCVCVFVYVFFFSSKRDSILSSMRLMQQQQLAFGVVYMMVL